MSFINNTIREVSRIAKNISHKQDAMHAQILKLDKMKISIENLMGSTATSDDEKIIGIISVAVKKVETAQENLNIASDHLSKWANNGFFSSPTSNSSSRDNSFFDSLKQSVKSDEEIVSSFSDRNSSDEDEEIQPPIREIEHIR